MVRTVRLVTNKVSQKIDAATEQLIETFKDSRVGTEVTVNSSNKKFRKSKIDSIEVFYPDAF